MSDLLTKIATTIKVDPAELANAIKENQDLDIPVKHALTDDEYNELKSNVRENSKPGDDVYKQYTGQGKSLAYKGIAKELGFEKLNYESDDEFISTLKDWHASQSKQYVDSEVAKRLSEKDDEFGKVNSTLSEIKSERDALKQALDSTKTEYESKLAELQQSFEKQRGAAEADRELSYINIPVPKHVANQGDDVAQKYIKAQRENHAKLFNMQYDIRYEDRDGKQVQRIYKNGELVLGDLDRPASLSDVVQMYASENFLDVSDGKSSNHTGLGGKPVSQFSQMSKDDFNAYLKEKGIRPATAAADKLYAEWRKSQT